MTLRTTVLTYPKQNKIHQIPNIPKRNKKRKNESTQKSLPNSAFTFYTYKIQSGKVRSNIIVALVTSLSFEDNAELVKSTSSRKPERN